MVIIVGSGAGGAILAMELAKSNVPVTIIEKGKYISYANCGLPYYIGGSINSRDKLFVQTVEGFINRYDIDIKTRSEVEKVDT